MLSENYELGIEEVAAACGISSSSLRKKFNSETNLSPNEYRLNIKLSPAKNLLEATDMSVNEIQDMLGFFDTAAFCRLFKKHMGMTPKQFSNSKQL